MELEMSTSTTVLGSAITAGPQRASRQTINTSKIAYGFDSRLARTAWFTSASVELAGRASPPLWPCLLAGNHTNPAGARTATSTRCTPAYGVR
jgi:hypothetical protein